VSKRYIREWGDINIMAFLKPFREMKEQLGHQLSNLVRLHWNIYKRVKKKKADKKKKTAKGKKGKKGAKRTISDQKSFTLAAPIVKANLSKTMVVPKTNATKATASPAKNTKTPSVTGSETSSPTLKVMAKDNEGSIDLTTGQGNFGISA